MMSIHTRSFEELPFDLVVAGGGLAGLCAAIAAARHGMKVALVQDRPVFGGCSSSEIRVVPHGCSHSNGWSGETGIMHDILLEERASNHVDLFDYSAINSNYDLALAEAVRREPNITAFMNTSVRDVETELVDAADESRGRRITGVFASQLGSEREFLFRASQYIDATGDGTMGFRAGADFRYGREARGEYGEPLAPLIADDSTLGSTITMRICDIGRPVAYTPPSWSARYTKAEDLGLDRALYHLGEPAFGGYWWIEIGYPFHQIRDYQTIRDELHRHIFGVWNFMKNHSEHKEKLRNCVLDWVGQIPGKRESRRLLGDVILTEHDCHEDRRWPDGVAYAGWWIDLHQKGGLLNRTEPGERENVDNNYKHWIRISPYSLPLRAFYSRNVENLWMAGRVISVTHVALGPMRVQLSLAAAGQAVGTAAAHAIRHRLTPRQTADPQGTAIVRLRQILLKDDVRLLGAVNRDAEDRALEARASAASEAGLDFGEPDTGLWTPLERDWAQVVPLTDDRVETVAFYLKNETAQAISVTAELQSLDRIWDRTEGVRKGCASFEVPAHGCGWYPAEFHAAVEGGRPYRIILKSAQGLHWAAGSRFPVGTMAEYFYECHGGSEPRNAHFTSLQTGECDIPSYRHWRQVPFTSMSLRISPTPLPFGAANVNNGRAWPEGMPNLWISDPGQPLPQSVSLQWDGPVPINTVYVSFDTGLHYTPKKRPAFHRAPECVKHWRLWACVGGEWLPVYEEDGNFLRRRRAVFPEVRATALKLEVLSTNGSPSAAVYELRAYFENHS